MTTTSTAIVTPAIDAAVLEITRELIGIGRQLDALQMKLFKLAIACDGRSDGEETPGKSAAATAEVTGNDERVREYHGYSPFQDIERQISLKEKIRAHG